MKTVLTQVRAFVIVVLVPFSKGQSETINATLTESYIYSPGYFSGAYEKNVRYDYRIITWYPNHTIILTLSFCEIEDMTKWGCADWFKIYDGTDDTAAVLVDNFCCQSIDLPASQSTGSLLYIVFQSDNDTQARGFKLTVISDGPFPDDPNETTTSLNPSVESSIWDSYTTIILGSAYGGLNLVGVFITVCCVLKKKKVIQVTEPDLLVAAQNRQ